MSTLFDKHFAENSDAGWYLRPEWRRRSERTTTIRRLAVRKKRIVWPDSQTELEQPPRSPRATSDGEAGAKA